MSQDSHELAAIAAEWSGARCLYPVYRAIAERFHLHFAPCVELELPVEVADRASLARVRRWLQRMDNAIEAHQLRVFLQTNYLSSEDVLRELVCHFLRKASAAGDVDRDKLDFLLVQYFSQCAPPDVKEPSLEDVERVLHPVLGEGVVELPEWAQPLDSALERMGHCASMRELLQTGVLSEVREIKISAGQEYFSRSGLLVFTRFNYRLRQAFFRLMRADVEAIRQGVRELAVLGVSSVDCERAGLSNSEPLPRVLRLCQQWRKPFQAEYSAGNPFAQIAELRAAVEDTLKASRKPVEDAPQPSVADAKPELEALLARLPAYLKADPRSRLEGATVRSGKSRMVLSPAEVRAFVDAEGTTQGMVRRAVACRLLLFQALEQASPGGPAGRFPEVFATAKVEAEHIQNAVAQARSQGLSAATLCTAAKRLSDLLERAATLHRSELSGQEARD